MKTTMRWAAAALAAGCAAAPAWALYKVVGPDGKVTYTDRPPTSAQGQAVPVGRQQGGSAADASLPYALRTVAEKFPVVMYTTANCEPCDRGRDLLRTRGVPFRERTVTTDSDREAWHRQFPNTATPLLTVGSQRIEGLQVETWHSYLDAAGYPKESALPASYRGPAPQALAPAPAPTPAAAPTAQARREPEPAAPPPTPGGFRF